MMKHLLKKHLLITIAATALLSACGGGGSSSGPGNEEASDLLAIVKAWVNQGGLDNAEPLPIDSMKATTSDDKEPDSSS
jgi:hypothetical protein